MFGRSTIILTAVLLPSLAGAEPLIDRVADLVGPDEARTLRALEALSAKPEPQLVGPLVRLLDTGSLPVQRAAASALGAVGVPDSSAHLRLLRDALVRALGPTKDPGLREVAALALVRYPFPDFRQPLVDLTQRGTIDEEKLARRVLAAPIDRAESQLRLEAYLELTQREASTSELSPVAPELASAIQIASANWPSASLDALGSLEGQAAFEILDFARRHGPQPIRVAVIHAFRARPLSQVAHALADALQDPGVPVRRAAIDALRTFDSAAAAELVAAALGREKVEELRLAAKQVLERRLEPPVFHAFSKWPAEATNESRAIAVELLSRVDTSTTTRGLVSALAWSGPPATAALAALRTRDAEPQVSLLLDAIALSAPNDEGRRLALEVLEGRSDPRIAPLFLSLLRRGLADAPLLAALAREPESVVRPEVVALFADPDLAVRRPALALASSYRGPDVVRALSALAREGKLSSAAFELLCAQERALSTPLLVDLLKDDAQSSLHPAILIQLRGASSPEIAPAVVRVVERSPVLFGAGFVVVEAQEPPFAAEGLSRLAHVPGATEAERARATTALGEVETESRERSLLALANDASVDVKMAARGALHRLRPEKYPEWDPYGRIPLVAAGAAFGASTLMLATEIADADLSLLFTGSVGLVLGGATPFLLTMDEDVRLGDAAYFATTGLWGSLGGYGLGLSLSLDHTDELWTTLLGQAIGVTAGALTLGLPEWSVGDAMLANFTAAEVGLLVGALAHTARPGDPRSTGLGLLGAAATTIPMTLLARRLRAEGRLGTLLTTGALGTWLGAWLSRALAAESSGSDLALGLIAGQSSGFLLGLGLAQVGELSGPQLGWTFLGGAAGAALGGGLGLSFFADDPRAKAAFVAAGTTLGAVSLGLLAETLELSREDVLMVSLLTGLGMVAGGDFMVRSAEERFDEPGFPGGVLVGGGLGLGLGLALSQLVEPSFEQIGGGVFGGALFGLSALGLTHLVPGIDVRPRARAIGIASGVGVLAGGLLAEELELSSEVVIYASTLGVAGAVFGGASSLYFDSSSEPSSSVGGGALFGASTGMILGLGLSELIEVTPRVTAASVFGASAGSAVGLGLGLLIPNSTDAAVVGLLHGFGAAGLVLGPVLSSMLPPRALEGRSLTAHVAWPMLQGTWQGMLLPLAWSSEDPRGREMLGGALLGAGLGSSFGLLGYHLLDDPLASDDLMEVSLLGGLGGTMGAGLGLLSDRREVGAALATGLGLTLHASGYWFAPKTSYSPGDLAAIGLGGASAAWMGSQLVRLRRDAPSLRLVGGGLLLGTAVGLAGSTLLSQWLEPEPVDVLEVGLLTTAASAVGAGLAGSLRTEEEWPKALARATGTGLGLLGGALVAELTEYDERAPFTILGASMVGGWQGAWLPLLWNDAPTDATHSNGALMGFGAGALAGTLLSQIAPREPADQVEIAWAGTLGNVLAGGAALAATELDRVGTAGLLTSLGIGGYALGYALSPQTEYSGRDMKLIALTGSLGAWHGGWLPPIITRGPSAPEVHGGSTMLGFGLGMLGGQLVGQFSEVSDAALQLGSLSWLTLSVGAGGLALFANTDIEQSSWLLEGFGLGGLALGLALGDVLELQGGDVWLITLASALGGMTGATLPVLTQHGDTDEARNQGYAGGTMLGASAGAVTGMVLTQVLDLEPDELARPTIATGTGALLGLGLGLMIPKSDARGRLALLDGGAVLGLGAGLLLAKSDREETGRGSTLLLGAAMGAALGGAAPVLYNGPDLSAVPGEQVGGGLLFGSALGLSAGFLLDETLSLDGLARERMAAGAAMGMLSGTGLGLAFSTDDRLFVGLAEGLTLLGAVGAGLAPRDIDFSWSKAAAGTTYLGYLSWHSLGLSFLLDGTDRQAAGVLMATIGLGSATGLYLLPELEPNLPDTLTMFAGSMWGAWIGAWSGAMAKRSVALGDRESAGLVALSSALGSDLGLALSALVVSKLVDVEPVRFAAINLAGLTGMVTGMITAGFLKDDPLLAGNVIGSLSGLAIGALVTSFIDFSKTPAWDQILDSGDEEREHASQTPSGGSPFTIHSWYPGAQVLPAEEGGAEQYVFSISGFWD